jgi:hypothetical protein
VYCLDAPLLVVATNAAVGEPMFDILREEGPPGLLDEQHPYPLHEAPVVDASLKEQDNEQHTVLWANSGAEAQVAFDLELFSWHRTSLPGDRGDGQSALRVKAHSRN